MKAEMDRVKRQKIILTIGLFFLIVTSGLFPRSVAAEERPVSVLTLADALKITREKNKDILKAQEFRKQVEGRYIEERAAVLPQFTISSSLYRSRDESQRAFGNFLPLERQVAAGNVGLSQVLFTFGKVGAAIRAARMGMQSAAEQLRVFRHAALRDVSAAFYDVLLAGELQQLAVQNLEQKIRHRDDVQKKFQLGVATEYDVLSAQVALENARPDVTRAENLVLNSREKLRFLLGLGEEEIDARGDLEQPINPAVPREEALARARRKRPDVADLKYRMTIAAELVTIARAGDKPRLDLKADWGWSDMDVDTGHANGPAWTAGVFLSYPIFDGLRTKGQVIQAQSNLATLRLEEARLMDDILLQTTEAVNAVREAAQIVQALAATVDQADRLLMLAEKGYEFGVKTKLEVDDAALNRLQARGSLARARRDYLVALVTLDWVMGSIGEEGGAAL